MLAADRMRFGGKDLDVMWAAFARRGMGQGASTPDADSGDTSPSFASPRSRNGTVTFRANRPGKLYVGHYEARATPVADTTAKGKLTNTARFVPGRYEMLYVSPAGGFKRFHMTVRPGTQTVTVASPKNLAAKRNGARLLGSTEGSLNPAALLDGTERTAWGGVTAANVDESHPYVAVDLAGGVHTVRRVQVSAMLNPAPPDPNEIPLAADPDPDSGSRFTALRRFALEACVSDCGSAHAVWKRFYVSPADAFRPSGRARSPRTSRCARSTCRRRGRPPCGSWSSTTSAPATPGTPGSRTTIRSTTPTARRRRTGARSCTPLSCRCTDGTWRRRAVTMVTALRHLRASRLSPKSPHLFPTGTPGYGVQGRNAHCRTCPHPR